ncbi:hypothetical protein XELAEV_18037819mg [Xenopus laevis]|uniref:Uncharacterized protein n=1 Tax=Xenopus laevis TaxID=8355 RepID=A0A974HAI6_XENLA|nr:hypothetical protein XELAEV_18037819mg [Xenopus laevis]
MKWIHRCGCLLQLWMSLPICVNPQGKVCPGEGRKIENPGWFPFVPRAVCRCLPQGSKYLTGGKGILGR